ncbi:hypothetical protein BDW66DRAFT_128963 [Aspergillus desertorum]
MTPLLRSAFMISVLLHLPCRFSGRQATLTPTVPWFRPLPCQTKATSAVSWLGKRFCQHTGWPERQLCCMWPSGRHETRLLEDSNTVGHYKLVYIQVRACEQQCTGRK